MLPALRYLFCNGMVLVWQWYGIGTVMVWYWYPITRIRPSWAINAEENCAIAATSTTRRAAMLRTISVRWPRSRPRPEHIGRDTVMAARCPASKHWQIYEQACARAQRRTRTSRFCDVPHSLHAVFGNFVTLARNYPRFIVGLCKVIINFMVNPQVEP